MHVSVSLNQRKMKTWHIWSRVHGILVQKILMFCWPCNSV